MLAFLWTQSNMMIGDGFNPSSRILAILNKVNQTN